jgi:hypothetical protein
MSLLNIDLSLSRFILQISILVIAYFFVYIILENHVTLINFVYRIIFMSLYFFIHGWI